MNCSRCGTILGPGAQICPMCGQPQLQQPPTSPAPATAAYQPQPPTTVAPVPPPQAHRAAGWGDDPRFPIPMRWVAVGAAAIAAVVAVVLVLGHHSGRTGATTLPTTTPVATSAPTTATSASGSQAPRVIIGGVDASNVNPKRMDPCVIARNALIADNVADLTTTPAAGHGRKTCTVANPFAAGSTISVEVEPAIFTQIIVWVNHINGHQHGYIPAVSGPWKELLMVPGHDLSAHVYIGHMSVVFTAFGDSSDIDLEAFVQIAMKSSFR